MGTSSLPRLAHQAAALIAAAHPEDARMLSALRKAQLRILDGKRWEVQQGILRIRSESNPIEYYLVEEQSCPCKARGICWHMAAWRILSVLAAACDMEPDETGRVVFLFPPEPDESKPTLPAYRSGTWRH